MENTTKEILFLAIICFLLAGVIWLGYQLNKQGKTVDLSAPIYGMGINDGIVSKIVDYAQKCSPNNVEAFEWINTKNKTMGAMLRCSKNNETLPFWYSELYFININKNG